MRRADCRVGWLIAWGVLAAGALVGCAAARRAVRLATSLPPQVTAPLLAEFHRQTGFDVDTTVTPIEADAVWTDDFLAVLRWQQQGQTQPYAAPDAAALIPGAADPYRHWYACALRPWVLVMHPQRVPPQRYLQPAWIVDAIAARWREQAALPHPGRSAEAAFHLAALTESRGEAWASAFFDQLQQNRIALLPDSEAVVTAVARGERAWGLADATVAARAMQQWRHLRRRIPDQDGLGATALPVVVVLFRRAGDHPGGRRLIDFLLSAAAQRELVTRWQGCVPTRADVPAGHFYRGGERPRWLTLPEPLRLLPLLDGPLAAIRELPLAEQAASASGDG